MTRPTAENVANLFLEWLLEGDFNKRVEALGKVQDVLTDLSLESYAKQLGRKEYHLYVATQDDLEESDTVEEFMQAVTYLEFGTALEREAADQLVQCHWPNDTAFVSDEAMKSCWRANQLMDAVPSEAEEGTGGGGGNGDGDDDEAEEESKLHEVNAVVIRRSSEEHTVALISATCDSARVETPNDLYGAVSLAVSAWVRETEEGKLLKEINGGDVNVGDLADGGIDDTLWSYLRANGVLSMEIETHSTPPTGWDYDDNLSDDIDAVEKDDEEEENDKTDG